MKKLENTPLPKSVIVFGVRYKVVEKSPLLFEGIPVFGLCDPAKKVLSIEKNDSQIEKWGHFFHEVGHAIADETGISQNVSHDTLHPFIENIAQFTTKFIDKFK